MKRYGILPPAFDPARDPIDVYQTDQAYWRSLWHRPARRRTRPGWEGNASLAAPAVSQDQPVPTFGWALRADSRMSS